MYFELITTYVMGAAAPCGRPGEGPRLAQGTATPASTGGYVCPGGYDQPDAAPVV